MVHQADFRADGQQLLTAGGDATARIWDMDNARPLLTLHCFDSELWSCGFLGSDDECLLVSRQMIHHVRLPAAPAALRVGKYADFHVEFPGTAWPGQVLTADNAQRITLHDEKGAPRDFPPEPIELRAGLRLSPDQNWLVSTSRESHLQTHARIYDRQLRMVQEPIPLKMAMPLPVFGPGNQLLLVDVGDLGDGACAHYAPDDHGQWQPGEVDVQAALADACKGAKALAYHAPTATLAIGAPGSALTLYQWNAAPPGLKQPLRLLPGTSKAHQIAFAPDGQRLLLAGMDTVVRLVERSGQVKAEMTGHLGSVVAIGFSPRGDKFLIAASESGVTVHDLDGRLLLPIRPRGVVSTAAFLPDGERILIATSERTTRIVPIEPEKLVELARSVARPKMSDAYLRHYKSRVGDD